MILPCGRCRTKIGDPEPPFRAFQERSTIGGQARRDQATAFGRGRLRRNG